MRPIINFQLAISQQNLVLRASASVLVDRSISSLKRSLLTSFMGQHVRHQMVLADEALGALLAHERRLFVVAVHMPPQVIFVAELLRTDMTFVRFISLLVAHHM